MNAHTKTYWILFYVALIATGNCFASSEETSTASSGIVTFYFQRPGQAIVDSVTQQLGTTSTAREELFKIGGIPCSYAGYLDYSNKDGLVTFNLHHKDSSLRVIITPTIKFNFVKGKTISHTNAEVQGNQPLQSFLFEKKKDDAGMYYWNVTETKLKPNEKIRSFDLIIFANPSDIMVGQGKYFIGTEESNHVILPNCISVLGNTPIDVMDMQQYLKLIDVEVKNDTVVQKLIQTAS